MSAKPAQSKYLPHGGTLCHTTTGKYLFRRRHPIVGFATAKVLLFCELHNKNVYNFVFAYKMGI